MYIPVKMAKIVFDDIKSLELKHYVELNRYNNSTWNIKGTDEQNTNIITSIDTLTNITSYKINACMSTIDIIKNTTENNFIGNESNFHTVCIFNNPDNDPIYINDIIEISSLPEKFIILGSQNYFTLDINPLYDN